MVTCCVEGLRHSPAVANAMSVLACAATGSCDGVAYVSELTNCLTNSSAAPAMTLNYGVFLTCALLLDQNSCSSTDGCQW